MSSEGKLKKTNEPHNSNNSQMIVAVVSDDLFFQLHAQFDAGERNVSTGKTNGTNRSLYRDKKGFIRERSTDGVVVRHSHMQKERKRLGLTVGYATEGDKRIGALREKGNKYAFKEWEYDATTGKPTKAVYQNIKTGNLKRISRLADDVIACNKCGDKSKKQKKCSRCLSVYYCSAECQRSNNYKILLRSNSFNHYIHIGACVLYIQALYYGHL